MVIEFWLGGARRFTHDVLPKVVEDCLALPKTRDRFSYWREITGDARIEGHVLVWTPIREK